MEIYEGVEIIRQYNKDYQISFNQFLIKDDRVALVDAGMSQAAQDILKSVKKIGKLDYILLTHYDMDHAGAAKEVQDKTGAQVMVGDKDAPLAEKAGIKVTRKLKDGDVIDLGRFKVRVVEAPSDSRGGVVYYCEGPGILFTGDYLGSNLPEEAIIAEGDCSGAVCAYHGYKFEKLKNQLKNGLKKIQGLDVKMIAPGHGYVVKEDAKGVIRKALEAAE
jgi:glyoxylase-like metal-dependent hydrolase (beta-lactamase superfamily II)